ncbi:unnamed protein product [Ixodes persulcatus]
MHLPILGGLLVLTPRERAWSATVPHQFPSLKRKYSELPDYDAYRLQEKRLLDERQRNRATTHLPEVEGNGTLLLLRAHPTEALMLSFLEQKGTSKSNFMAGVLKFLHANKILLYVACSCVLTGVVLLFTLMTVYNDGSRTFKGPSFRYYESHPLLDGPGIFVKSNHDDDSSEDVSTRIDEDEIDTRTPATSHLGPSAVAPYLGG